MTLVRMKHPSCSHGYLTVTDDTGATLFNASVPAGAWLDIGRIEVAADNGDVCVLMDGKVEEIRKAKPVTRNCYTAVFLHDA